MNEKSKETIMNAVLCGTLKNVQNAVENHNLALDESFFDYELLKAALERKHQGITNFLLKKGCRVRNPNMYNVKEETPLHLAMKLNKDGFIKKILTRGASVYDKNHLGETPMYSAFKKGYFCAVYDLLHFCSRSRNLNPKNKDDILHFHIACVMEDLNSVKVYLASGFDVNSPLSIRAGKYCDLDVEIFTNQIEIYTGMTPLHFAAMYALADMVQLHLENGANINKVDKKGRTPLHYAISEVLEYEEKGSRINVVTLLLQKKASLEIADKNQCTPLHLAFYYGNSQEKKNIFDMLMSNIHWGSTNATDYQGLSYFHIACTTNDINQVKELLAAGVDVNKCVNSGIYSGYTPLHFAVLHNQKNIVELLLSYKAQVNVMTFDMRATPLHLACQFNYVKFHELHSQFEWELQNNKAINLDTNKSRWSSNCDSQLSIIKNLLLHGADVESKDIFGKTPVLTVGTFDFCLHCELNWSNCFINILNNDLCVRLRKIIEILLENGAKVTSLSSNRSSILHIFSANSFLEISDELIEFLINQGLDIESVNDAGSTALHVAVKSDNTPMVQILLKYKANVNAECEDSMTPLQLAIKNYLKHSTDKKDIICMLLENGSDVNTFNENGKTLLSAAIAETNVFVTAKLLQYGANINLKDSSGKSCVSSLYKWHKTLSGTMFIKYAKLFEIVYIHIQKLLALDLHVCCKVLKCCNELYPVYNKVLLDANLQLNKLDSIYDDCKKELEELKLVKVDAYTSLYNILVKDRHAVSKHVRNSSFIEIVNNENIEVNFPFYGHLIKNQFKKGLERSCALKSSQSSLDNVLGISLPDSCYDSIIKHLTDEEIANMNAAVEKKRKM